jgi:hypothetical protein
MSADVAALSAPKAFWQGITRNVMRVVGVDGASATGAGGRGLPVVVYIDGQVSAFCFSFTLMRIRCSHC